MAATRRGQPELHVRMPSTSAIATALPDLPPISALFLIDFDVKAGYTISWKAAKPGVELDGTVEYKSLPSGLHTVSEDLIYFVHDEYAGLSAFINAPVEDSEVRNARMLAVGVLVPLSYGRLGRAWRHAQGLKDMASKLVINNKDTQVLEQYWEKNQARDGHAQDALKSDVTSVDSPSVAFQTPRIKAHTRNRSASDGAALVAPEHKLSPFHPAWSLTKLLDTFGPLIFPIQRAALLRKRILISCHTPVQQACDFVYNISILSNIPVSTFEVLPENSPSNRLQPLFCIGVHDIPSLTKDTGQNPSDGWIACTTDSILAMKDTLWDMLITLPPPHTANAQTHVWPTVECPRGNQVKATQRDLRRFRSLKLGLARVAVTADNAGGTPEVPRPSTSHGQDESLLNDETEPIVEPLSWAALAYNGFMWWASAGEQIRSDEAEETSQDSGLLADFTSPGMANMSLPRSAADLSASVSSLTGRRKSLVPVPAEDDEARTELAIIAYFQRLTTQILTSLADMVESTVDTEETEDSAADEDADEDDPIIASSEDGDADRAGIRLGSETVRRMGLDVWSPADTQFVIQVLAKYFDRKGSIEGKGVEVCGVRVC